MTAGEAEFTPRARDAAFRGRRTVRWSVVGAFERQYRVAGNRTRMGYGAWWPSALNTSIRSPLAESVGSGRRYEHAGGCFGWSSRIVVSTRAPSGRFAVFGVFTASLELWDGRTDLSDRTGPPGGGGAWGRSHRRII